MSALASSNRLLGVDTCPSLNHESGPTLERPQALLTCIVFSYNGNHVHFVDGSDGGYALAARSLKAQLKSLS
jgi:hypothetical protein